jgi:hypothetical protein
MKKYYQDYLVLFSNSRDIHYWFIRHPNSLGIDALSIRFIVQSVDTAHFERDINLKNTCDDDQVNIWNQIELNLILGCFEKYNTWYLCYKDLCCVIDIGRHHSFDLFIIHGLFASHDSIKTVTDYIWETARCLLRFIGVPMLKDISALWKYDHTIIDGLPSGK